MYIRPQRNSQTPKELPKGNYPKGKTDSNTNEPDDSPSYALIETPTNSDKIYDSDAPSISRTYITIVYESHMNATQKVEWNDETVSDNAFWNVEYKYTESGGTTTKVYSTIVPNHRTIPTSQTNP